MKRRRILYIESNTDGTIGGSYYSLLYLLEGLNRELYEPYVLFCQDNILIPKFGEVTDSVLIDNYDPSGPNPFNSWKTIPRFVKHVLFKQFHLQKIINEVKPDLVHLNNTYAANHEWILACILKKAKIVAHDRGTRPPASLQTRIFVRFLDAIICVSDAYLKNVIGQGLRPKRALRVYNGLDTDKFKTSRSILKREKLRKDLGVGQDEVLIGMVGNVDYWKGQMVFCKAVDMVLKNYPNTKAILIGKTALGAQEYEAAIRNFLNTHGISDRVMLIGFREDVPALLNAMDIFVHASVEPEPFARVILEAMAMEKPIVATNSGGTPEQIINGESGILVPMNDEEAMAKAIEACMADRDNALRLGKNALDRLRRHFSISNMVHGVEQVYEEVFRN